MANIKNFGLVGIGSDVQFGKSGPRLINDANVFKFRNAANTAAADLVAGTLTAGNATVAGLAVDAAGVITMGGNKVTNVANGTVAADGINFGQLTSALTTVAGNLTDAIAQEVIDRNAAIGVEATARANADTLIRTDFAAADNVVRAEFAAADTVVRTDFAAADTLVRSEFAAADTAVRGEFAAADALEVLARDAAILVETNARIAADALKLNLTGGTLTGSLVLAGSPTLATHAVSKGYVDSLAGGLSWQEAVAGVNALFTGLPTTGLIVGDRYVAFDTGLIYTATSSTAYNAGVSPMDGYALFDKSTETGYVFNGTIWTQFTGTGQIVAGLGMKKIGNRIDLELAVNAGLFFTPDATDEGSVLAVKLDTGASIVATAAGLKVSDTLTASIAELLTDMTAVEGRALALEGRATAIEGAATTLTGRVTAAEGAATTLAGRVTTAEGLINGLQTEVDATQAGAGLSATGAYVAETTSNYINGVVTLKAADFALDAAIKQVANDVAALGTGSISSLQTEVNNLELTLGALVGTDGLFVAVAGSNYFTGDTTVTEMFMSLDAVVKSNANAIAQEVTDRNTAITTAINTEISARNLAILTAINALTTSDIEEGTNLYFTQTRARDSLSVAASAVDVAGLVYDAATGVFGVNAFVASKANVATAKAEAIASSNAYTDAAVSAAALTNVARAAYVQFAATASATAVAIATVVGFVHRIKVYVTGADASATAIQVGTTTVNNQLATTAEVDSSVAGLYVVEVNQVYGSATPLSIFLAAGTVAGTIVVEYLA